MAAATAILYISPPGQTRLFPPCPFHALTGLLCPGCGTTRALHELLHGHWSAAMTLNPLTTLFLPVACAAIVFSLGSAVAGKPWRIGFPRAGIYPALAATLVFGVWRNIP
jgi:hypothetical protein